MFFLFMSTDIWKEEEITTGKIAETTRWAEIF